MKSRCLTKILGLLIAAQLLHAVEPAQTGTPPQIEISDKTIHAKIYLPDAHQGYYQATRFDWSGVIASLEANGHSYFGKWFDAADQRSHDPKINDAITGPVEEFQALGYNESKPGETFVKIGVGSLRKPNEPAYRQFATYEIADPGRWTIRKGASWIEFTQQLSDADGYSYIYRKRLSLDGDKLILEHHLKNIGKKTIATSVYEHDFYMLDGQPSGPDTAVKFAFTPRADNPLKGLAEIHGKEIDYPHELATGQTVLTPIEGFSPGTTDYDIRVENQHTGAAVRQTADHPIAKMVLWSIRSTVCPEAYIDLKVAPGHEEEWQITWEFYTIPPAPYIGTYSKGIYQPGLVAVTTSPSFLAAHPSKHVIYAANESSNTVSAFAIEASGQLKLLNSVPSRGDGPCHIALDKTGNWLFAANYNGGSVAVFPVHDDGSLGEATTFIQHSGSSVNHERQAGPHAHSVNISSDNRFLLVTDLGLDRILIYRFDAAKGTLTPNEPPFMAARFGAGPRHLAFTPDGHFVYVINELSATVVAYQYDAVRGSLKELQTLSTLPEDFTGPKSGAEIAVHPNGNFLYASNRGDDSIAVFRIDPRKGTLTDIDRVSTQGKTPRNFAIDPSGTRLYAANQDSNSVVVFRIDEQTGGLTPDGKVFEVPSPVCVLFIPEARTK
jgi:6-phosphogluconolactonase